jgi:acetyl-CoA carboxylase biotin carboxyl carrier protein
MKNICQVYFQKVSIFYIIIRRLKMSDNLYQVVAPLMGTFYRSSAPGEPALVEQGQKIAAGDIVCVIESMKIFTELRSEHGGTITQILAENEEMVMKGQPLITIEKE